jgi:hypothetical protein
MTPSKISQPVNNVQLPGQNGGSFVVKEAFNFVGGDVLIGFSASGWSANANQLISMQLWLDDEPVPSGLLQMFANSAAMHLSLGHAWAFVEGVSAGQHAISLMAGDTTITDGNDQACITVWELGDNLAVQYNESVPCPQGAGVELVKTSFRTQGTTPILVSASTSGWNSSQGIVGATVTLDQDINAEGSLEVFANNANQHLAAVPTDIHLAPPNRGQHELEVVSHGATWTDGGDMVHVNVVEWVDPAKGPTIVGLSPPLQNAQAQSQNGDGGSIASATFQSSGGTLLVRTNLSAWSASSDVQIMVGIQIDGTSRGFAQLFANPNETHMTMVSNDLVVAGIPAGQHTLNLMGELNTITDQNDRVSVTILEF